MFIHILLVFVIIISILYVYFKQTFLSYQNDDLVIIHPFFQNSQFRKIRKYCLSLDNKLEKDSRVESRKTYMCDSQKDMFIYKEIFSPYFFKQIKKQLKLDNCFPSYFPIEYRKYETGSQGMDWHQDKALFKDPYYECVLTLTNDSDSLFEFMIDDKINSVEPKPNSLVLVKPSTIYHKVTPLQNGERRILKFVFLLNKNNEESEDYDFESKV